MVLITTEHPYPQQVDLMKSIISTIQRGRIGLFESPTGYECFLIATALRCNEFCTNPIVYKTNRDRKVNVRHM